MRVNEQLIIAGTRRSLVERRIVLDLQSPGRAMLVVKTDPEQPVKRFDLVAYAFGYASQAAMQRWFIGYVDTVVQLENKRTRLLCRELSAALSTPLPMALRHVSMRDVGQSISETTGLQVVMPGEPYSTTKTANFYNLGNGHQAVQAMQRVFSVPDFICQQQAGALFLGSWADSRWASMTDLPLPDAMFTNQMGSQSAKIPALPQLRPGMRVRGERLQSIELAGTDMTLNWGDQ